MINVFVCALAYVVLYIMARIGMALSDEAEFEWERPFWSVFFFLCVFLCFIGMVVSALAGAWFLIDFLHVNLMHGK